MSSKLAVDYGKLNLFVRVAETGSLTRAAVLLGTEQSAVSRQISALEREWKARLFHRTGRGVALTDFGKHVLPQVKALLLASDQLAADIKASAGVVSGDVRIALQPSLSIPLVTILFRNARERFPGVRLHLFEGSSGQIDEWLVSGRVDIAMPYRYGMRVLPGEERLAIVDTYLIGPAGDAVTRASTVRFTQLDRLPLVLPSAPNALRVLLDQLASRKRISLLVMIEADSLPLQKEITASCGCYTVLPLHAVASEVKAGRLQASRIVGPAIERTIVIGTTTQRPLSMAGKEIAKLICGVVRDLAGSGAWQQVRR